MPIPSTIQRFLSFIGLSDEYFGDDEEYIEKPPRRQSRGAARSRDRYDEVEPEPEPIRPVRPARTERSSQMGTVRPIGGRASQNDNPPTRLQPVQSGVRPLAPEPQSPVIIIARVYKDIKEIADTLKAGQPVVVNLTEADTALQRRVLDFSQGVTYAISGKVDKVADKVYLMLPSNVKVSDDDRARFTRRETDRER